MGSGAIKLVVMMKKFYKKSVEEGMVNFYDSLSEKDRRRYAAVESLKLDRGGKTYICSLLGGDPKTIQEGLSDLEQEEELNAAYELSDYVVSLLSRCRLYGVI